MPSRLKPLYKVEQTSSIRNTAELTIFEKVFKLLDGHLLLWQHHGLFFGQLEKGEIRWAENSKMPELSIEHTLQIRCFNAQEEYFYIKKGKTLKGRHRKDYPADHPEWQADATCSFINSQAKLRSHLIGDHSAEWIQVRNYLSIDEVGKTYVSDMRFVQFNNTSNQA